MLVGGGIPRSRRQSPQDSYYFLIDRRKGNETRPVLDLVLFPFLRLVFLGSQFLRLPFAFRAFCLTASCVSPAAPSSAPPPAAVAGQSSPGTGGRWRWGSASACRLKA